KRGWVRGGCGHDGRRTERNLSNVPLNVPTQAHRNVDEVRSRRSPFGDDPHGQWGGEDRGGPSVRRDGYGRLGRRAPSARLSRIAIRVDDRHTSASVHVDGQVFSERVFEDILTPRHRETVFPDRRVRGDRDDG